jgi:HEAT repeat protein
MVAGDEAVGTLDKLLNGKSFLGKREPAEIRAAAALALGKVPGAEARASLNRAVREEDPVVRSAVNRALRSE